MAQRMGAGVRPTRPARVRAVDLMVRLTGGPDGRDLFTQVIVPLEVFTPENV